jgi:hypothetical protein
MEATNKFWEGGKGAGKNGERSGAKRASKRRRRGRKRRENATTADWDVCNGPLQATIAILAKLLQKKIQLRLKWREYHPPPRHLLPIPVLLTLQ